MRSYNVGRFPQAINHVQLTRAFSLFPDWPWCLPELRRSNGIVALPLAKTALQPVRLQAMWRTQENEYKQLSTLRRTILAAYDSLLEPPAWKMASGTNSMFAAGSVGFVYFLGHPSDVLPSLGGWHEAKVIWKSADGAEVTGHWLPAEDKAETCRLAMTSPSDGPATLHFMGEAGFRLSGNGVLAFTARKGSDRSVRNDVLAGRVTLLAGGTLASSPLLVSQTQLKESDRRALRQLLDDSSFTS